VNIAIVGAGPIGAAVAQALAERARFREIRLIDDAANVAAGKALDLRQAGPIARTDVDVTATTDLLSAAGSRVVVFADPIDGSALEGEAGLALVRRLARSETTAPFVFAGPSHVWLMEKAFSELNVPADRLVGSAASAQVSAVRALTGLELGLSGVDVDLSIVGRPPRFVIGWSSATVAGSLVSDRVAAHRLLAISDSLARLWPPGPQAIGTATARIAEGLAFGSRRLLHAMTIGDGDFGARGTALMLPLELGQGRVLRRVPPSLSAQESTRVG
jgi:malate dehydrogenase